MREAHRPQNHQIKRYLGLELSGAKNEKTTIATMEYYPRERKMFLLDIYDRVAACEGQSGDDALLEILAELEPNVSRMGVNVPLTLPPCIRCARITCPMPSKCATAAVQWMRKTANKAARVLTGKREKIKYFTPYTQRPIELWVRHHIIPSLKGTAAFATFNIDETLGGNKAPLTARMDFLKKHIKHIRLVETWPKLTIAAFTKDLNLNKRLLQTYRHLEEGAHARNEILESLATAHGIFIYERDMRKLSQNLTAFDAFFCAYTALLSDIGKCTRPPPGYPVSSGWVEHPI